MDKPIIGQEAVCPDGLGRVIDTGYHSALVMWIQVDTYMHNRSCKWDACNVKLVKINLEEKDDAKS